jgi:hypothetical protein
MRVRSPLFSQSFFRHLILKQGIGHAHAAKLAASEVVAGLEETVPPASLLQLPAGNQ